jgi:hypothetical protein
MPTRIIKKTAEIIDSIKINEDLPETSLEGELYKVYNLLNALR